MADLQKVVKLTSSQYSTLASGGTVGSYTGLDSSYLYLVEDSAQYVPLGGTTSLYGSIVPSTTNSYTLGTNLKRFKSVYASHIDMSSAMINTLSASTVYTSWVQAWGSGGVWTSQVMCPVSSTYIICDPAIVGGASGGELNIYAGSYIKLSTPKSIFLYASGDMDLYAHDRNNIYGGDLVKIWAGNLSDTYPVPRISMWLSGGYYPIIDIAAEYSGMGEINIHAPVGKAKINGRPIVAGWQHNVYATCTQSGHMTAFALVFYTNSSAPINTGDKLWTALWKNGYSFTHSSQKFVLPVSDFPWSTCGFLPVISATAAYWMDATANVVIAAVCAVSFINGGSGAFALLPMVSNSYYGSYSYIRFNNLDATATNYTVSDCVHHIDGHVLH